MSDLTPFTVTGVDFTGALCLFTCATTRAVATFKSCHRYLPDTFLLAFQWFASLNNGI